jgi:hypothetical protein
MECRIEEMSTEELVRQAEEVMAHRFALMNLPPVTLGNPIDWRHNATPDPRAVWTRELNRHGWWSLLAGAYQRTHEERFAEKFAELTEDWIRRNPPPEGMDETDPIWSLMSVGMRCLQWTTAFSVFYHSPAFTDELKWLMLRSIYDHGNFLNLYKTKLNHLIRESVGLACVGCYFPEFKDAELWRKVARGRLAKAAADQMNADGSNVEVASGYHWLVTEEFEAATAIFQDTGYPLPSPDWLQVVEKAYWLLAQFVRPNGTFPDINDGFIQRQENLLRELVRVGQVYGRDDLLYVGSRGRMGTPPAETSTQFENAGFFMMRSDWSSDARFLLLDAGPYGGSHGHEDKLNIDISAYGHAFVVDPGSYTYDRTNPYRIYFAGTYGHNSVLVDGLSQIRRWHKHLYPAQLGTRADATWASAPEFDYVMAAYRDGYGAFAYQRPPRATIIDDVTHVRHVLFVKPDYWIVVDEMHAARPHEYQLLFHTHPDVTVAEVDGNRVFLGVKSGDAQMALVPVEPDLSVRLVTGSEDPIQGWFSDKREIKYPATTVIFEKASKESTTFATLVYPSPTKIDPEQLRFEQIPVTGGGNGFQVYRPDGVDTVVISPNRERKEFLGHETTGQVACVRTDSAGNVRSRFEW